MVISILTIRKTYSPSSILLSFGDTGQRPGLPVASAGLGHAALR